MVLGCVGGPLLSTINPFSIIVGVFNNGTLIAKTPILRERVSPAFLSFDAMGHIAARHLDSSIMAPTNLYPGFSTPAKAGEIISLYGTGFGSVPGGIVAGSATQTGNLNTGLSCWVLGLNAPAVGALVSPPDSIRSISRLPKACRVGTIRWFVSTLFTRRSRER